MKRTVRLSPYWVSALARQECSTLLQGPTGDYENPECAGLLLLPSVRSSRKFRSRQIDPMGCGIQGHSSRAIPRLHSLHHGKFSWRRLPGDEELGAGGTGECLAIVKFDSVDTLADRQIR